MKLRNILILVVYISLVGCGTGGAARTATEHRVAVLHYLKSGRTRLETIEVNRPYAEVAELLKNKSEECLRARVHPVGTYTPTIVSGPNWTEIHIRLNWLYVLVADVTPNGNQGTKVDLYEFTVSQISHSGIAMRHWINGTNLGCPNLARTGYE